MIKSKKQMYIIVSVFLVILILFTTTYAFFNYTRTGTVNTIKTGRIVFNSQQGTAINLTNMFPIDVTNGIPNDATKVGTVTINVTGDITYTEGLEYLVSAVNVTNTLGSKSLPICIDVAVANNTNNDPSTTLGTSDDDYFTDRGGDTSYYKVLANDTISTNDELVVGYIAPGATGVDGNIVIRAYLDASKIAISDTYDESDPGTDNMGTTAEWVDERTIFTTTEWNSLQQNGVSFQIKVESNEGVWFYTNESCFTIDNNMIKGYDVSCGGTDVIIPSVINGNNIDTIYFAAFSNLGLTSVTLPKTILYINGGAFQYNNIKKILIPDTVIDLDGGSFMANPLEYIDYRFIDQIGNSGNPFNSITSNSVTIKINSPIIIPQRWGGGFTIKELIIGENVKTIAANAFDNDIFLSDVVIPSNVETWYCNAFPQGVVINNQSNVECLQ